MIVRAVGAGLVALALTACNRTGPAQPSYWCEHDDSDVRVANSYCESGNPEYEWEPDGDDWVEHHRPHKTTSKKPTGMVAPATVKPTTQPTTSKKPWYKPAAKPTAPKTTGAKK